MSREEPSQNSPLLSQGPGPHRLTSWAGRDLRYPTANSRARWGVARGCGQGTLPARCFHSGPERPRSRGVQCGRPEPRHLREADGSRAHGTSLLLHLGNECQLLGSVCRCSTTCLQDNPTCRHQTVQSEWPRPRPGPAPQGCSVVAELSKS